MSSAPWRRTGLRALLAVSVWLLVAAPAASASTASLNPPSTMTGLGDSITRAFHTQTLLTDTLANSWTTGTNTAVNSLCLRIRAINSAMSSCSNATSANDAVTGAKMTNMAGQAGNAVARSPKPQLVTVLLGANDVCTSNEAGMTTVANYEAQFRAGMEVLRVGAPDARVQVLSIPNIYNLWNVGRTSGSARLVWGLLSICQSMLASPTATDANTVARRERVRARNEAFNTVLKNVCAEYVHCRYDDNAAYNLQFALGDLSTIDYFHPNNTGQSKAALTAWSSGYDYADRTAPVTTIERDRPADGVEDWYRDDVTVSLSATDDAGVKGSEFFYKLVGEVDKPWTKYTGPFTISAEGETDVIARSVDVNGNTEASQSDLIKIDRTAPTFDFACTSPVVVNGDASQTVSGVQDNLSGFADDYEGTSSIDTSIVGTNTTQAEIKDKAGNRTSHTCEYDVRYAYSGVLQPLNADGSSIAKLGSTIPVKFRLEDAAGADQLAATARIELAKITDEITGNVVEGVSTSAATTGNLFRVADGQYVFNLSTKGLSTGTWTVRIVLDDGTTRSVNVSLR